jgi:ketosteroid isomerase-like protein
VTDAASGEPAYEATEGLIDRVEAGERVLVRTHVSGRGRESGVPAQLDFFSLFRIEGGRIAAQAAFFDRPEAEEALRGT